MRDQLYLAGVQRAGRRAADASPAHVKFDAAAVDLQHAANAGVVQFVGPMLARRLNYLTV